MCLLRTRLSLLQGNYVDELPQDSQATEVMEDVLEEYDSQATEELCLSNSEEDHSSSSEPVVAAPDEAKSDGPMVMCPCESMTGTRSQRYMPYTPQLASTFLQEIHQENRCTCCEEQITNHDYCEKYQEWFCKTVFEPCIPVREPRSYRRSFIQRNLEEDMDMHTHSFRDSNVETYTDFRQELVKAQQAGIERANQAWESLTTQQANTPSVHVVSDTTNSDDKSEPDSQATQDCFADEQLDVLFWKHIKGMPSPDPKNWRMNKGAKAATSTEVLLVDDAEPPGLVQVDSAKAAAVSTEVLAVEQEDSTLNILLMGMQGCGAKCTETSDAIRCGSLVRMLSPLMRSVKVLTLNPHADIMGNFSIRHAQGDFKTVRGFEAVITKLVETDFHPEVAMLDYYWLQVISTFVPIELICCIRQGTIGHLTE
jgi:hypothetical protein